MNLKVKRLRPEAKLPSRATTGASGFDLHSCINDGGSIQLNPTPKLIGTGIALEVPPGYDAQIRPRSGLSAKGVGVTLGTVDSDYRGEVMVTMYMMAPGISFEIKHGDRIAQLVIHKLADVKVVETEALSTTERGAGGHGSTGR
jgi:dUTP pyrophosphatase